MDFRARTATTIAAMWITIAGCDGTPPPPMPDASTIAECTADVDCDDMRFCNGAETCAPEEPGADPRGCITSESCMPSQRCLEEEGRCVTRCAVEADADGDGHDAAECGGADCDDADAQAFPGNVEICDPIGRDEDCDRATLGAGDRDHDGFVDVTCCNGDRCGDD